MLRCILNFYQLHERSPSTVYLSSHFPRHCRFVINFQSSAFMRFARFRYDKKYSSNVNRIRISFGGSSPTIKASRRLQTCLTKRFFWQSLSHHKFCARLLVSLDTRNTKWNCSFVRFCRCMFCHLKWAFLFCGFLEWRKK